MSSPPIPICCYLSLPLNIACQAACTILLIYSIFDSISFLSLQSITKAIARRAPPFIIESTQRSEKAREIIERKVYKSFRSFLKDLNGLQSYCTLSFAEVGLADPKLRLILTTFLWATGRVMLVVPLLFFLDQLLKSSFSLFWLPSSLLSSSIMSRFVFLLCPLIDIPRFFYILQYSLI